jgi:hypothetical protein
MNEKKSWSGNMSLKGAVLVALVSLVIGLGISGSLDWLSPSRALVSQSAPEVRTLNALPDFVVLAKKMRPIVVNISTTQVSESRGQQPRRGSF